MNTKSGIQGSGVVQTRICPGCNTVHDLPLCPERRSEENSAPRDSMGHTLEELARWMLEHAEQRDQNAGPRGKTVNMKFTRGTLRTWIGRVRDALGEQPS